MPGVQFNSHLAQPGDIVFRHACKMGLEGIVSKRVGSRYRSGRSTDWLKFKNPDAPGENREAEEDWGFMGADFWLSLFSICISVGVQFAIFLARNWFVAWISNSVQHRFNVKIGIAS